MSSKSSDNPASKPMTAPGKPEDISAAAPAQADRPSQGQTEKDDRGEPTRGGGSTKPAPDRPDKPDEDFPDRPDRKLPDLPDEKAVPDDKAARDEEARQAKARKDENDKARDQEEERLKGSKAAVQADKAAQEDIYRLAFEQGSMARQSAISRLDAPHDPHSQEYPHWLKGWDQADGVLRGETRNHPA